MRLLMTIASKCQLGCSVKWIGARYYSFIGVLIMPKDKRLKAVHDFPLLQARVLNCADLRSLNGLLEVRLC